MNIERVTDKVIISGDIVEIYRYSEGYLTDYDSPNKYGRSGAPEGVSDEDKQRNKEKRMHRARNTLRRLINANIGQYGDQFTAKFITLTFAEHITTLKDANADFKKFVQRANYAIYGSAKSNLKYVAIPEFTKIGRVHYHVIFFNLPFVKANEFSKIWAKGFIKINKIDQVDNVGAYVTKYMTKENDDPRLEGQKSYMPSKGLLSPEVITDKEKVDMLATCLPAEKLKYQNEFENEYVGRVSYSQYNFTTNISEMIYESTSEGTR